MTARLALAALLLTSTIPTVAVAKPVAPAKKQLAEAKAAFQKATADYDAANYDEALKGFERAHELSRNPLLFFNMAACAEKMNQARVAAAYLRTYLSEVPTADDANKVRERIGSLEERAHHDDERRADEERRAEDDARRRKEEEERARQAPPPVAVVATQEAPPPAHESIGKKYKGGFIALGVTGAFGIATAALGGLTLARYHHLNDTCAPLCAGSAASSVHHEAMATDAFIGLTSAAAVATVVLFAIEARHQKGSR